MDIDVLAAPYGGVLTADALLVMTEEEQQCASCSSSPPFKRPRVDRDKHNTGFKVPVHRAVLWSLSEYFASKFKNWSCNDGKPQITILVPAGQLEIGKALIASLYDKIPADLSQQQLMQLLVLAESYRINKVTAAVASSLSSIPTEEWQWETVLAVDQLSAAEPMYASLIAAATARRMQLLGDLEVVWASEGSEQRQLLRKLFQPGAAAAKARAERLISKSTPRASRYIQPNGMQIWSSARGATDARSRLAGAAQAVHQAAAAAAHSPVPPHQLLLQLPFDSLIQLLESPALKAESDNTVHYTITRWLQQHPEVTSTEQLQRLAGLVRLSHCTPNYFTYCVCCEEGWLPPLLSASKLARAAMDSSSNFRVDDHGTRLAPELYLERMASGLQQLDLAWVVSLAELKQRHEQAQADDTEKPVLYQASLFMWQGLEFRLLVGVVMPEDLCEQLDLEGSDINEDDLDDRNVHGLYADIEVIDEAAAFNSTISVWKVPTYAGQPQPEAYLRWKCNMARRMCDSRAYLLIDSIWHDDHDPVAAVEGVGMNWEQLEGLLRQRGVLSDDGCLHISAVVSTVV